MAKCSGCSANCGCRLSVSNPDPSLTLTLMGDGSASNGWVLSGVASGGGGSGQVLFVTVGTPGPVVFGGLLGTPPDLLATADFVTDGVNDNVGIQQAIDAVALLKTTSGEDVILLILPGLYLVNAALVPKGITIRGYHRDMTTLQMSTGGGAPANTRLFDGSVSGTNSLDIADISLTNVTGAATIFVDTLMARNNSISSINSTDLADVVFTNFEVDARGYFSDNSFPFASTTNLSVTGSSLGGYIISNNTFNGSVVVGSALNLSNVVIENNFFNGSTNILNITADGSDWKIVNNTTSGSMVLNPAGVNSASYVISGNSFGSGMTISDITSTSIIGNYTGFLDLTNVQLSTIIGNNINSGPVGPLAALDLDTCLYYFRNSGGR